MKMLLTVIKVVLYPNRTNEVITILSAENIEKLELYTIQGQQIDIKNKIVNNTIEVSGFSPGIYFVTINSNQTFKINKHDINF